MGKIRLTAGFFIFFLSLHHPNNRLENFFNSAATKVFLGRKNIGGAFAPLAPPKLRLR
jgi:hypothetical protein